MPQVQLPFKAVLDKNAPAEHSGECGLLRMLPEPLQKACGERSHLLEYLHLMPVEEMGIPEYYPTPPKKLGDAKQLNLVYPVSPEILIHVLSVPDDPRALYIPVEPVLTLDLNHIVPRVEERLLDYATEFTSADTEEEKTKALVTAIDKICTNGNGNKANRSLFHLFSRNNGKGNGACKVSPRELQALKYLMVRDKIRLGILEPMVHDKYIEDISCSGVGNIFVEHKIFHGLKSAVSFADHDELDEFVLRLAEHIKKPVTLRSPVVDATLPDGSRINIVYGREISQRGSNFTIRKFAETPLSVLELIEFGSLDYMMAGYLSLVLEEGMNMFVSGETASGKTTLLNAITTFIPSTHKIISIEDTPELQVPHQNWLREVSKTASQGGGGADVSMFSLLKAALRQRPNVIIIGEIRGEEGNVAFQAMQTGHAVMATFHAASVEKLIQRLTGNPINVPKTYVDNLNVVVIQSAVKLPNGKKGRRALSINEIVSYDPVGNSFSFVEVFRWDPIQDKFEFVGDKNSYLLEQKIALKRGIPADKKWKVYEEVRRRARILEKLHKEKGITDFYELLTVLAQAQKQGLF